MTLNLLKITKNQLDQDFYKQVSTFLEQKEITITKAVDEILPSIITGMMINITTREGAHKLIKLIDEYELDDSIIPQVQGVISSNDKKSFEKLCYIGTPITLHVFGGKTDNVINLICQNTGLDYISCERLFSLHTPMVLGILGEEIYQKNLDTIDVSNILIHQKGYITDTLPTQLPAIMGTKDLDEVINTAKSNFDDYLYTHTGDKFYSQRKLDERAKKTNSMLSQAVPAFAVALIAMIAWMILGDQPTTTTTLDKSTESIRGSSSGVPISIKLINGKVINIVSDGIEDKMMSFINDESQNTSYLPINEFTYAAGRIMPEDGRLTITENISIIMEAYSNIDLEVIGVSQQTDDEHVAEALKRADHLRNLLIKEGVSPERLTTSSSSKGAFFHDDTKMGIKINRSEESSEEDNID